MRLAQASHHLTHRLAGLLHGGGALDLRPQFVVNRRPVDAAEAGIPVLIANGGPDQFEGFDVEALLLRGKGVLARLQAGSGNGAARVLTGGKRGTSERATEDSEDVQTPILQGLWLRVRRIRRPADQ